MTDMGQYLLIELKKHLNATEEGCLNALSALATLSHIRDSHTAYTWICSTYPTLVEPALTLITQKPRIGRYHSLWVTYHHLSGDRMPGLPCAQTMEKHF